MLNEPFDWRDVRYQVNRHTSYDVHLSFVGRPDKKLLPVGTKLYRLDFPVVLGIFMKVWWMGEEAYQLLFETADPNPSALRQEWQNTLSLRRPGKGGHGNLGGRTGEAGPRTQVLVIVTTRPVFAWVGKASPLFHKEGGAEQIYLPNLASGAGPYRSEHARLLRTYTLPAN